MPGDARTRRAQGGSLNKPAGPCVTRGAPPGFLTLVSAPPPPAAASLGDGEEVFLMWCLEHWAQLPQVDTTPAAQLGPLTPQEIDLIKDQNSPWL